MGHHHHHHGHDHEHNHAASDAFNKAYIIGICLNAGFVVAEVVYGFLANSLALLADAGHNAGDTLGLFMAWGAARLAKRQPSTHHTYGLQSSSILAALVNAVFLLIACGGISLEAIQRLFHAQPANNAAIMAVAAIGILVNGGTALLFMKGRNTDLNIRGAFLHMAADAAVSLGVVVSGYLIMVTGWLWLDPVTSIVISLVIVAGTWSLLRDSFKLALHGTPSHIKTGDVKNYLASMPEVKEVHDLHIWAMSTTETALSVHLVMRNGHPGDAFLEKLSENLEHKFRIGHATIQIELGDTRTICKLAPDSVV